MILIWANLFQGLFQGKSRLFWALQWQRAKRVPLQPLKLNGNTEA
jgi:hypothetical protein